MKNLLKSFANFLGSKQETSLEKFGWYSTCKDCGTKFSAEAHAGYQIPMKGLNFEVYECPSCKALNLLNLEIAPVPLTPEEITSSSE